MKVDFIRNVGNQKPLDVGCGSLSASIQQSGRILSLNGYHKQHGFITLSSIEQFPNNKWYDSNFVRQYRRRISGELADKELNSFSCGFGISPLSAIDDVESGFLDSSQPFYVLKLANGLVVYSLFFAETEGHQDFLVNRIYVVNESKENRVFTFDFGGRFHLHRSSYGQLTEGGPIPIPDPLNKINAFENHVSVVNPGLSARCDITLSIQGANVSIPPFEAQSAKPIDFHYAGEVDVPSEDSRSICVLYSFNSNMGRAAIEDKGIGIDDIKMLIGKRHNELSDRHDFPSSYVIARNVDYIVSCCSVPITDSTVSIITDHQLLPLSWNRDAYYMIHLLLTVARDYMSGDSAYLRAADMEKIRQLVRGHILWMFTGTRLPDGYWGRSYLANGFCKDEIYQLDQQCYPLLELRDYLSLFDDEELIKQVGPEVLGTVRSLLSRKEQSRYLFATSETPADDKVSMPYHFSSHILLWFALQRLSDLCEKSTSVLEILQEIDGLSTGRLAEEVKAECLRTFSVSYKSKPVFAYLSDGNGSSRIYHDANDLPVVLAPLWGFIDRNDERWVNTMKFAFSSENTEGYFSGIYGGLGSTHTPHPWPLGYAQELLFLSLTQKEQLAREVLRKLAGVMMCDGLFSEAVHEADGHVESRTWFSWPGAFISDVLLLLSENGSWL